MKYRESVTKKPTKTASRNSSPVAKKAKFSKPVSKISITKIPAKVGRPSNAELGRRRKQTEEFIYFNQYFHYYFFFSIQLLIFFLLLRLLLVHLS
jgi:hypothetical protein